MTLHAWQHLAPQKRHTFGFRFDRFRTKPQTLNRALNRAIRAWYRRESNRIANDERCQNYRGN